ncbi:MAG: hypothetical protein JRM80_06480 [Nitrososphaerota archaeon]|nr:hypothetical protein [Nitrososphaerota archaeon]
MQRLTLASIVALIVLGTFASAFLIGQAMVRPTHAVAAPGPSQAPASVQTTAQPQPQNSTSLLTSPPPTGSGGSGDDGPGGLDD